MTTVRVAAKVDNYGALPSARGIGPCARRAEEAGFHSVWTSDHVVLPGEVRSFFPFSEDGQVGQWEPNDDWYDAIVTMAVMAEHTERVEIGPGVLVLPQRHPVTLAKQLATIDAVSGGRVALGVGAGWLREEFEALNTDFDTRGSRMDEWIDLLRACWTGAPPAFDGRHYRLPAGVFCRPTPAHNIPIIVGGMSQAALHRVATRGDGWFPLPAPGEDPVEVVRSGLRTITEVAARERDPGWVPRVVLNAAAPGDVAPLLADLARAGVTDVLVDVDYGDPEGPRRAFEVLQRTGVVAAT